MKIEEPDYIRIIRFRYEFAEKTAFFVGKTLKVMNKF